ncbi:MAG: alpha-galactosidase, partial [Clostridiales bacterium]|nr:alpha-galactosidase [Clostridiales bacterium]
NPFVMLAKKHTTEDHGECYGINLVYSGNHYEAVHVDGSRKMRLLSGINPTGFCYQLKPNEQFEAPEAVMAYSNRGYTGMSHCMHYFVQNHIVRGQWKKKQRPVLLNSWEAAYFKFDEGKLLKMAKDAKELGIELFVLDDGWFGKRDDDKTSLGDWTPNLKKLPGGVKRLAEKINALGLEFGIWVEPEMVSEDSECYRAHPDWAVKIANQAHSFGRNQMILDLTKTEVIAYIKEQLSNLFSSANISYVKWDMNRIFSDYYSNSLSPECQGEFSHRYVQGLYQILEHVQTHFPHILLEGCASGGNRFDLGMLCYAPQIWASDNTDPICRAKIQTGYSYGYPMSVVTAHVSDSPNHQTLRNTPMDTRYQVACFGLLGYECNLLELQKEEWKQIAGQIELYKKHRETLQFGDYYRLGESNGQYQWMVVSKDKKEALGLYVQGLVTPNYSFGTFKTKGLAAEKQYHFYNRPMKFNIKEFGSLVNMVAPIHIKNHSIVQSLVAKVVKLESEKEDYIVSGSVMNHIGIRLKPGFASNGYDDQVRFFQDFASRLYIMEEVESTEGAV